MLDLTVAIVSHGHRDYLERCLPTVFAQADEPGAPSFDVHLVVNQNADGAYEWARNAWPKVVTTMNSRRLGFSANNNLIYRRSRSRYILLLNPDTEVRPGAFREMWEFMERTPECGIAGPKLLYPDGRLQLSCRRFPTLRSWLLRRTPLRTLRPDDGSVGDYTMGDWDHEKVREVDWMFGAALFVRRAAAERVGLLDEDIFLFCEDIDWCYRFHKHGWKIFYVPTSVVVHDLHDAEYDRYWSIHGLRHYRSMMQVAMKHGFGFAK
ncbi:MAG: glycosyltransferase family 2 protein [Myxococcales bacterium]|nr:glycosyltransferase family 2 protein [Myxococcales bacterium]